MFRLNLFMTLLLCATMLGSSVNPAGAAGLGFDHQYVDGAMVVDVYGPGDDGARTLSVKVYTFPDGRGNLANKVGIVDITDRSFPYGPQLFSVNQRDSETFSLKSGGRNYYYIVTQEYGESRIVIKRPGASDRSKGVVSTSVEALALLRLDQIAGNAPIDIGGREYYVLGQGGIKGALLFFSRNEVDGRRSSREPYYIEPVAMAFVSEVIEGVTRRIRGRPDLGQIDGVAYHLEFDGSNNSWRVVEGQGD